MSVWMMTSNFGQGHDSGNESPELPPRVEDLVDDQPQCHQQQQPHELITTTVSGTARPGASGSSTTRNAG
eukprot:11890087-Prorocentrum_lima.AAC.1